MQPVTNKSEIACEAAIRSLHGHKEDMSNYEIRSDNANELVNSIENSNSFANPVPPHRSNANKAERSILTFTDLLRIHFVKSGLSPCFRPLLAVFVAQLWNLFRNVKRTDIDGNTFFSTPYRLRHGNREGPIDMAKCPMPGQLVTYVPAEVHKRASAKVGPRGLDAIFIGFFEAHGKIDSSGLLIPLEPLLTGVGSISPLRTKDFRIPGEASFPLARLREWNLMIRGSKLVANISEDEYHDEVSRLTDISTPYIPKVEFERPVGVSHRLEAAKSGIWIPETCQQLPDAVSDDILESEQAPVAIEAPVALGSYSESGSSGSGRVVASAIPESTDSPVASPDHLKLKASLKREFSLQGLGIATFIRSLEASEGLELAELEELIRRAERVLKWTGETGGGLDLSGKPVIKHKDSKRPSCTEPELYDPLTSSQKAEHIQLVSEQKRSLASKLAILKE